MPTKTVDPPIFKAIKKGDVQKINSLISKPNYNPQQYNSNGLTPLYMAILEQDIEIIELLLKFGGSNVNFPNPYDGRTAIFYCIEAGIHAPSIFTILKKYAEVNLNAQDFNGDTALHVSTIFNLNEFAHILLMAHADLEIYNKEGVTPLLQAIMSNANETAILFIENGADLYKQDKNGFSPLFLAIIQSNENLIKIIIDKLSNDKDFPHKLTDNYGNTPLHIATRNKSTPKVLELLESKGFKWNTPNLSGQTPLDFKELQRISEEKYVSDRKAKLEADNRIKRDLINLEKRGTSVYEFCNEHDLPESLSDILFNKNYRKLDDYFYNIDEKQLTKWGVNSNDINSFFKAQQMSLQKAVQQAKILQEQERKRIKAKQFTNAIIAIVLFIGVNMVLYLVFHFLYT